MVIFGIDFHANDRISTDRKWAQANAFRLGTISPYLLCNQYIFFKSVIYYEVFIANFALRILLCNPPMALLPQ